VRGVDGVPVSGAAVSLSRVNGARVEGAYSGIWGESDAGGILLVSLPAGADEIEVQKDKLKGRVTVNVPSGGLASGEVTLRPFE
jgi:hypothetical protein